MGAEHVAVPVRGGRFDLAAVLRLLGERGVNEAQVEAGATLVGRSSPTGWSTSCCCTSRR